MEIIKKVILFSVFLLLWTDLSITSAQTLRLATVGVKPESGGLYAVQTFADTIAYHAGIKIILVALPAKRAEAFLRAGEIDGDF